MSDPVCITLTLAAAAATGICTSQGGTGGTALTLNGTLTSTSPIQLANVVYTSYAKMDVARRIILTDSGSSDSAVVFTISGYNRDLQPITQAITGVTATPVATTYDFLYVTSIVPSATLVGTVTAGTNTTGSSAWVHVNPYARTWALSAAVAILSGSLTYSVEHTYDDVNKAISPSLGGFVVGAGSQVPPTVWLHAVMFNQSANLEGQYGNQPIMAHRLTITAGTGTAAFYSLQAGLLS